MLITAFALMYAIGAPAFGPFSDRWGRRNLLIAGVLVFGAGNMLTAFSSTFSQILLSRAIAGLGGGMVMPSVYALVGDVFPYEKRGVFSAVSHCPAKPFRLLCPTRYIS
ncbi:MFS transporter, partial [Microbacteriaceae bacterium K1510]|nr:MFS transporter [Microbacteriaceae bacterium K1510]